MLRDGKLSARALQRLLSRDRESIAGYVVGALQAVLEQEIPAGAASH